MPDLPESQLSPLHRNIARRLDALGLSREVASREAGLDKTYLRKMFERADSSPRGETLGRLAGVLKTTVAELLTESADDAPAPAIRSDVRPANVSLPPLSTLPNDVPVMGTASGSHLGGAFQFEGGVIDWVRRPPGLHGSVNAYALFVEGTSMIPEHNPGDLRFIHPDRPPRIGDSVIVQVQIAPNDQVQSMIGRLLKRTEATYFIGKLNPEATVQLKRGTVMAVHKVLTLNDLFGV